MATASRDLKKGVDMALLEKDGNNSKTKYRTRN
jgi:Fic family protein